MDVSRDLSTSGRRDAWHAALDAARAAAGPRGGVGYGVGELVDGDGVTALLVPFTNLITDAGDLYNARRIIEGIAPASAAAPSPATGMKLGTSATIPAKNSTGASLVTYLTGSNVAFDATYPQYANLGANLGVNAVYATTWAAGVATSATINEVVIVNDSGTNATSTAANTYARAVFPTTVDKDSTQAFLVIWNHRQLGS